MAGILGIVAVLTSLFLSFPDSTSALAAIGFSAALTVVGAIFILRACAEVEHLAQTFSRRSPPKIPGFEEDHPDDPVIKVGATGRALSPLRPAGTVRTSARIAKWTPISDGGFIPAVSLANAAPGISTGVTVRQLRSEGRTKETTVTTR